jgi:hypothetical protein
MDFDEKEATRTVIPFNFKQAEETREKNNSIARKLNEEEKAEVVHF